MKREFCLNDLSFGQRERIKGKSLFLMFFYSIKSWKTGSLPRVSQWRNQLETCEIVVLFMLKYMFSKETLSKKFITKWFWIYFFTFLIAPLWYIIKVIASNTLTIEEVWVLYSIISLVSFLWAYNDLGLTYSLWYFLPKFRIEKKYTEFKSSIVLSLLVQIVSSIIIWTWLWFASWYLSVHYFQHPEASILLKRFSIYFFWINILQVIWSILWAFQDTFKQKLLEFFKIGFITIIIVVLFFFDIRAVDFYWLAWIWWTWIAVLVSLFVFLSKYSYIFKDWKISFSKSFLKTYLWYAFWAFIAANAWMVLWQIDQQMIIYFLWARAAGFYTNYLSLVTAISIFTMPIVLFLFPVARESLSKKDWRFHIMRRFFYKYLSVFSLMLWWFFAILWPEIASILFGTKFMFSWTLFIYSGWFIIFQVLLSINFSLTWWLWLVKENTKILWLTALINIILNLIFIPKIWILWAVISTVIWWIIMRFMTFRLLLKNKVKMEQRGTKGNNKEQPKFIFERWFFIKNSLFLMFFLVVLYFFKSDLFVLDDIFRYKNLWILILVAIVFALYIAVVNWKEVILLKEEVLKIIWRK